jgi:hypothetical protein
MHTRSLAVTALAALVLGLGAAQAQQNDVKGWISKPKPPAESGDQGAGSGDAGSGGAGGQQPPKSISRGQGEPAPAPVANPGPKPNPKAQQPAAPAAAGDRLLATDPEAIQKVLLDAGYRAEMSTDSDGNPLIISESSRSQFWVMFLDCQSTNGCLAVEFYVGYTITSKPPADALNSFNSDYRYVRTYVGDGVVSMAMDVLMRDGGIDVPTFLEYLRLWSIILPDWETAMGV